MKQKALSKLNINTKRKGIVLLCIYAVLFASLVSYSTADSCINVTSNTEIKNVLGAFGAVIADLLYQYLGVAVFTLLPFAFYLSFRYVKRQPPRFITFKWIYTVFVMILLSVLLGFIAKYQYVLTIPLGGRIG